MELWHSQLEDIYQQSYFNLLHKQLVGDWVLGANLGYFIDRDDGSAASARLAATRPMACFRQQPAAIPCIWACSG